MDQQQESRWRPTRRQLLWAGAIFCLSTIAILIGYRYDVTLWDWLKLLVVPAVIAGGGLWFNRQQRDRELEIAREQREQELDIAERRTQDEALQAYLDQMSDMLIPNKDQPSLYKARPGDSLSSVARARTLTVLPRLDGDRKARVVQFLQESGLIAKNHPILNLRGANLSGVNLLMADLSGADLRGANLSSAVLSEAELHMADLSKANLSSAVLSATHLSSAVLSGANLSSADLSVAYLSGADLSGADLSGSNLRGSNLHKANLHMAHLQRADMSAVDLRSVFLASDLRRGDLSEDNSPRARVKGAPRTTGFLTKDMLMPAAVSAANSPGTPMKVTNLRGANLLMANLSEVNLRLAYGWTEDQLKQAMSIDGATMPDGQILKGDEVPDGPTFEYWIMYTRVPRWWDEENE